MKHQSRKKQGYCRNSNPPCTKAGGHHRCRSASVLALSGMLKLMLFQVLGPTLIPLAILLFVLGSDAAQGVEVSQAQQGAVNTTAPLRLQRVVARSQLSQMLDHLFSSIGAFYIVRLGQKCQTGPQTGS